MQPIQLSWPERATLTKLVKKNGTCKRWQLSSRHALRFIQLGLLFETQDRYDLTLRGQIEILRQRFRRMPQHSKPIVISSFTSTLLDTRIFGQLSNISARNFLRADVWQQNLTMP